MPLSDFSKNTIFLQQLTRGSHAYEVTQVRPEQRERPPHGPHFGTKMRAVDYRMYHLTGLRGVSAHEHYQAYECV